MKLVREHINFQRGLDPKSAMGIGPKALIKKWFDDLNIPPEKYVINPDLSIDYKYDLDLRNTQITSLPDNLAVNGSLDLRNIQITSLPDNLTVKGSLWLNNTKITSLPDNLTVKGEIIGFEPKVIVKESLEFQRGLDPKKAMNIGLSEIVSNWIDEIKEYKIDATPEEFIWNCFFMYKNEQFVGLCYMYGYEKWYYKLFNEKDVLFSDKQPENFYLKVFPEKYIDIYCKNKDYKKDFMHNEYKKYAKDLFPNQNPKDIDLTNS
jgi:hypothetical protein